MRINDIANEIFEELGEPEDITQTSIGLWLDANIGSINGLLYECFEIKGEEIECFNNEAKSIFKLLYMKRYYLRQHSKNLGAGGVEWTMIREGDSLIRRASKTDIAKEYKRAADDIQKEIDDLVAAYRNRVAPRGINLY